MNNVVFSTRNIDDFISDVANEVVKKFTALSPHTQIPQQDEIFTLKPAAAFMHLKVPTLRQKIRDGEIPCMKRGGKLYFSKVDLLNYLKEGRRKTAKEIAEEADIYLSKKRKEQNHE